MVSAVENMAANTSWAALGKATDLRNRILFTLGLLIVYRLGTFIPVPGIDGAALRDFMQGAGQGIGAVKSVGPAAKVVDRIAAEYQAAGKRLASEFTA